MKIFFGFALGLGLLFWGMKLLKSGLEHAAGERLTVLLQRLTTTPFKGLLTGTAITALIQSSTAVTIFSIGLVSAGLLRFEQTLGIILGANIGSTITAQLMTFNLNSLSFPLLGAGGVLFVFGSDSKRWVGLGTIGFALVFLGINQMSESLRPLSSSAGFTHFLRELGDNHLLGIVAGTAVAGLIHSSGVTTGMVIVLSGDNLITLPTAIALVIGANIGTCITAVLAALGGDTGAKRAALAHMLLNILGAAAFFPLLDPFANLVRTLTSDLGRQVAHAHTIFNLTSSLAALPILRPFTKLIYFILPEEFKST